jgi:adenine phosphoribosyltransferase
VMRCRRYTPDFPKPGVLFKDMSPLFGAALLERFVEACAAAVRRAGAERVSVVVGLEARGLALGALLARELRCGFVMARKRGKLPPPVAARAYDTEYSRDTLELSALGEVHARARALLVDDLVATGGSLLAAAEVCLFCFVCFVCFLFVSFVSLSSNCMAMWWLRLLLSASSRCGRLQNKDFSRETSRL